MKHAYYFDGRWWRTDERAQLHACPDTVTSSEEALAWAYSQRVEHELECTCAECCSHAYEEAK